MNIMRYFLAALFALSLTGPAVTAQAAVLPDQLEGKVAAQVDPYLLLRNLARLAPETFNQLLEQAIAGVGLPDIIKDQLDNLIANAKDPEEVIDFIENIDKTVLNNQIRQAISQFLVLNRDQILALIPNLPPVVKELLSALLPATIDLNQLPLAVSDVAVLNKSGWPLWFGLTDKQGDFKVRLPKGAVSLRVGHIGYQSVTIPLEQVMNDAGKIWLVPSPGKLSGSVFTGSGFRRKAIQNAKVTVLTAADVVTKAAVGSQKPTTMTNRLGLFSFDNISPLLPGLLGGIGVQKVEVDADDYYLEKKNAIFLAGSSLINQIEVREAPPVGRLGGLVRYNSVLLGALNRDNALIEVLNDQDQVIASGKSRVGTGLLQTGRGTYDIPEEWSEDYLPPDLYIPKGTYKVKFTYPNYPTVINPNVVIKSARATTSDACLNGSLRGTLNNPLSNTPSIGVNVRVIDANNLKVAETTSGLLGYSFDILAAGVYKLEFRADAASADPDVVREGVAITACQIETVPELDVYPDCYYKSWGNIIAGTILYPGGRPCRNQSGFRICNVGLTPLFPITIKVLDGVTEIASTSTNVGIYSFGAAKIPSNKPLTLKFTASDNYYTYQKSVPAQLNSCEIKTIPSETLIQN